MLLWWTVIFVRVKETELTAVWSLFLAMKFMTWFYDKPEKRQWMKLNCVLWDCLLNRLLTRLHIVEARRLLTKMTQPTSRTRKKNGLAICVEYGDTWRETAPLLLQVHDSPRVTGRDNLKQQTKNTQLDRSLQWKTGWGLEELQPFVQHQKEELVGYPHPDLSTQEIHT